MQDQVGQSFCFGSFSRGRTALYIRRSRRWEKKKRRVTGQSPALIQVLQKEELSTGTEVKWLLHARPKKGITG